MQFKARYLEMGKLTPTSQQSAKKGKASGLRKLICETQSLDDDEDFGDLATTDADPSRPWRNRGVQILKTMLILWRRNLQLE
jgi:hypothetical protein